MSERLNTVTLFSGDLVAGSLTGTVDNSSLRGDTLVLELKCSIPGVLVLDHVEASGLVVKDLQIQGVNSSTLDLVVSATVASQLMVTYDISFFESLLASFTVAEFEGSGTATIVAHVF